MHHAADMASRSVKGQGTPNWKFLLETQFLTLTWILVLDSSLWLRLDYFCYINSRSLAPASLFLCYSISVGILPILTSGGQNFHQWEPESDERSSDTQSLTPAQSNLSQSLTPVLINRYSSSSWSTLAWLFLLSKQCEKRIGEQKEERTGNSNLTVPIRHSVPNSDLNISIRNQSLTPAWIFLLYKQSIPCSSCVISVGYTTACTTGRSTRILTSGGENFQQWEPESEKRDTNVLRYTFPITPAQWSLSDTQSLTPALFDRHSSSFIISVTNTVP